MGRREESIVEERGSSRRTTKRKSVSHQPSFIIHGRVEREKTKTAVCRKKSGMGDAHGARDGNDAYRDSLTTSQSSKLYKKR